MRLVVSRIHTHGSHRHPGRRRLKIKKQYETPIQSRGRTLNHWPYAVVPNATSERQILPLTATLKGRVSFHGSFKNEADGQLSFFIYIKECSDGKQ
ncbi:hypothetical protein H8S90_13185 [Olivibacter sp. SDN3]|uniref:hypothetical protein n=1 Tax=Olivibacter sp. SDN3 TaxID=2764720 RepID=UPI0016510FF2|nr:hypothetical protein [Olivibacter sp. SDN3]QNL47775.1 hypothetical protein H8S90_13185 [Olivibacter sp. SDN3]